MSFKEKYIGVKLLSATCLVLMAGFLSARSVNEAIYYTKQDIDKALKELSAVRGSIHEEKLPLARQLQLVRAKNNSKQRDVKRILGVNDDHTLGLQELEKQVLSKEQELSYSLRLFEDYFKHQQVEMPVAEKASWTEVFKTMTSDEQLDLTSSLAKESTVFANMSISKDRLNRLTQAGYRTFEGNAIVPGGIEEKGEFAVVGPHSYFFSETAGVGLLDPSEAISPKVLSIREKKNVVIRQFFESTGNSLPIDATVFDAIELSAARDGFVDEVKSGGFWIYPILSFAVIAFLVGIFKSFEIYGVKRPSDRLLSDTITSVRDGNWELANELTASVDGPFGELIRDAVKYSSQKKEVLEEILYEKILEAQPILERYLAFISVIAATAPLLGLLGTVTGMINTFQQITIFGSADTSKLADGISEALITTKFGLVVAIPAFVIHAILSRKAQGVLASMEKFSTSFINGIIRKSDDTADNAE